MVLVLSRADENVTRTWVKSIRFDFENSLGNVPKGALRKTGQK